MLRLVALALLVAACSRPSPPPAEPAPSPSPAPASAAGASPAASPAPAPAAAPTPAASASPAPAGPLDVPVSSATATAAGHEQPLAKGAVTTVEPGARFRVEVGVPLRDARLSLLDADGAMVAAAGGAEIGGAWARYTLAPDAPLAPGSKFTLRLDGAVEREAHDAEGRAYAPSTWPLLTTGEKPKPEPKAQQKRRRR